MDVSGLYHDPVQFRRTMRQFAESGTLLSGRDIWLAVRAQPGRVASGPSFAEFCADAGLDLQTEAGEARAKTLLHACFQHGPHYQENPLRGDAAWQKMERWRQELLERYVRAPRNRVEVRTLETPPAFAIGSPGGDYRTPYEWMKAVHSFLDVVFVWLAENPTQVDELEYGELELQAAKSNEQAVLYGGLNAQIRWIPSSMHAMTAREALTLLLKDTAQVADALGRTEDLELIRRAALADVAPPAERIRREIGEWYGIDTDSRHNARLLPDDSYPRELLRRTREAMTLELTQVESDIAKLPPLDQLRIRKLLGAVRSVRPA